MSGDPSVLKMLKATVRRLADEPQVQAVYLRNLGSYPSLDELALEFDNWFAAVASDISGLGALASDVLVRLELINEAFRRISQPSREDHWRADALTNPEWNFIREQARAALIEWSQAE